MKHKILKELFHPVEFQFDGNDETHKHGQMISMMVEEFEAPSFSLAQQLQNQSLLDNKYVELEKKVNMEKERYEKEIEQLKDKKNVGPNILAF